jgi:hypothetical protein
MHVGNMHFLDICSSEHLWRKYHEREVLKYWESETVQRCLASSVAKAMEDKCEADSADILVGRGSRTTAKVCGELSLEQIHVLLDRNARRAGDSAYNGGISAVAPSHQRK